MKIKVEIDDSFDEEEIIIRCHNLSEEISFLQKSIDNIINKGEGLVFYQGEKEFYLKTNEILFFETEGKITNAHTIDDIYKAKYKLYELEELLPNSFIRISKSGILNVNHLYAISRNLSGASLVEFRNTHKKIYVSRQYYKLLKLKMKELR